MRIDPDRSAYDLTEVLLKATGKRSRAGGQSLDTAHFARCPVHLHVVFVGHVQCQLPTSAARTGPGTYDGAPARCPAEFEVNVRRDRSIYDLVSRPVLAMNHAVLLGQSRLYELGIVKALVAVGLPRLCEEPEAGKLMSVGTR